MSGRRLLALLVFALLVTAWTSHLVLRQIMRGRFAVAIDTVPESGRKLQLGRPLSVRIEKRQAGRSPLPAHALLVAGDGTLLSGLRALSAARDDRGRVIEEAIFPPLAEVPRGALVAALVVRIPEAGPETRARIEGLAAAPKELWRLHAEVLHLCREGGGHAEMVMREVRAAPR